jgi:methyl-accepting chemotaxis protein
MSKDRKNSPVTNSDDGLLDGLYLWYMRIKLRHKISLLVGCNLLFVAATAAAGLFATQELIALSPSATGNAVYSQLLFRAGSMFAVALILGPFFGFLVFKSVADPLANVTRVVEAVESGDLTVRAADRFGGGLGKLAVKVNSMADQTLGVIGKLTSAIELLAASTSNLKTSSDSLECAVSDATEQSTSSASAAEEMHSTAEEIARNCSLAAESSKQTSVAAKNSERVILETASLMDSLAQGALRTSEIVQNLGRSSDKIEEIVDTIEEIADQTNLLALNAAIEAARAGDHGRGFAVVADEVRGLAERTAMATKEISIMIKDIQNQTKNVVTTMAGEAEKVRLGALESEKSGQAVSEILDLVSQLDDKVAQIATAAEEQSVTTREVTMSLQHISEAVHTAADQAKSGIRESESLTDLSETLKEIVKRYKIA